ncbi:MAG: methenyltetrahydrofolate cyclohydrolase [Parcubacteria group bacterium]|nr:methenyltetrahydrofolate cyclohydrolase [Parcubacteria group bacterium]
MERTKQINGVELADTILLGLKSVKKEPKRMTFVMFDPSPAILSYIARKERAGKLLGVDTVRIERTPRTTEEAVSIIEDLNATDTNGIVIQLPLPEGIDTGAVLDALEPDLDVDILGSEAKRKFMAREIHRLPPVAGAVWEMLTREKVALEGSRIVVLGRGRLVGEPVGMLFEREKVPFEYIDIHTSKEKTIELLASADIIISGIGVPHFILPEMVREGVVIIDAGTSESNGKLAGDMHPDTAKKALLYTPVPGGVGPVTVAMLYKNLFI